MRAEFLSTQSPKNTDISKYALKGFQSCLEEGEGENLQKNQQKNFKKVQVV